jgi:DNA-binding CsgD family transcriptional regulator
MAWKVGRKVQEDSLDKMIESLAKSMSSIDKRFSIIEGRIDRMSDILESKYPSAMDRAVTERILGRTEQHGEQNEQLSERIEQTERMRSKMSAQAFDPKGNAGPINMNAIHGRHREILAMLINGGFHTYKEMADKLSVSQSRVRAYIAELRNKYNVPLRQIRDAEGYKIGVEMRFVEEILSSGK